MKKTAFAAKALLALLAAGMISCSQSAGTDKTTAATDSTATNAQAVSLNIRYVDLDSVMATYTLSKELDEQGRKLMLDYQRMENQKTNEIQNLAAQIEQKRNNNGYLTQESFDADVNNVNRKQTEAANILRAHQEKIQKQIAEFNLQLSDSVQNFIKDYNATRKYDAILLRSAGLYYNPDLDITGEIIEGLNARYTPKAEK
ncbi:MAG: OmpH family outer membrane protein [Muribaculaceae bacterium]|nr:OmpH family outer membrane protein [Muribaculaceae bacterium]